MPLQDLASIQIGFTFRSRPEVRSHGGVRVVLMKDLGDGVIDVQALDRIAPDDVREAQELRDGDLLFRSRGTRTTSSMVPVCPERTIFAAPLFRIRVESARVLPHYLNWFINHPLAQGYFESVAEGSSQKMINKQNLSALPVNVPSLETQRRVVDIADLARKEARLLHAIADKKLDLISSQLVRIIQEA